MNRKGFGPIIILLIVVAIFIAGAAGYYLYPYLHPISENPATAPSLSTSTVQNSVTPAPASVQAAYDSVAGSAISFLSRCVKDNQVIYEVAGSTGYIGAITYFDADGRTIGHQAVSDVGGGEKAPIDLSRYVCTKLAPAVRPQTASMPKLALTILPNQTSTSWLDAQSLIQQCKVAKVEESDTYGHFAYWAPGSGLFGSHVDITMKDGQTLTLLDPPPSSGDLAVTVQNVSSTCGIIPLQRSMFIVN